MVSARARNIGYEVRVYCTLFPGNLPLILRWPSDCGCRIHAGARSFKPGQQNLLCVGGG